MLWQPQAPLHAHRRKKGIRHSKIFQPTTKSAHLTATLAFLLHSLALPWQSCSAAWPLQWT
jgi:hypothetical protein